MRVWIVGMIIALSASRALAAADVVIVIDRAMPAEKLLAVGRALTVGLEGVDPATRVSVVAFAATAEVLSPLQGLRVRSARALAAARPSSGGAIAVGLRAARRLLADSRRTNKHVFLVTDRTSLDGTEDVIAGLRADDVHLYAAGYQSSNEVALRYLRGRVMAGPAELADTFLQVQEGSGGCCSSPHIVVFVIDRAGTDDQLDLAKQAVKLQIQLLRRGDRAAVVAFDGNDYLATRVIRVAGFGRREALAAVDLITDTSRRSGGLFRDLMTAADLVRSFCCEREVIVFSHGWFDTDGVSGMIREIADANAPVSFVSLAGPDQPLLRELASIGGGRFFVHDRKDGRRYFQLAAHDGD